MNNPRHKFYVHAELKRSANDTAVFNDAEAGRPIERRLNRMERVVMAYRGHIDQRLSSSLKVGFDTADAAVLSACEMQHRCAELPQVSRHRLALRIGIHGGLVRQRSKDGTDNDNEVSAQLAIADDGIVASEFVVAALNPQLRSLSSALDNRLDNPLCAIAGFSIDWQSEISSSAFGGESAWPASLGFHPSGLYLRLYHGLKTIELTDINPVATIGRNPVSDLVFVDRHISRDHCRIERSADGIMLIDTSVNGTAVVPDKGAETLVKNASIFLMGKGLLFFGRPFKGERRGSVRYEAY